MMDAAMTKGEDANQSWLVVSPEFVDASNQTEETILKIDAATQTIKTEPKQIPELKVDASTQTIKTEPKLKIDAATQTIKTEPKQIPELKIDAAAQNIKTEPKQIPKRKAKRKSKLTKYDEKVECQICHQMRVLRHMGEHLKTCSKPVKIAPEKYECVLCPLKYLHKTHLLRHLKSKHKGMEVPPEVKDLKNKPRWKKRVKMST